MDIKELRIKTGLSQREFGERLGLTSQSITKYEAGASVSTSVQRLIRYEFAKFLPENERLGVDPGNIKAAHKERKEDLSRYEEKVIQLENLIAELKKDKDQLYDLIKHFTGKSLV